MQTLIDDYVAVVSAPRSALTVRKGATADIDALVRQTMGSQTTGGQFKASRGSGSRL
ncbi:MAG: hypothetical protein IPG74_10505 [Flavobacteriales bacterium]|nr:hypothetical protein [Flavobacteriales bacterium]